MGKSPLFVKQAHFLKTAFQRVKQVFPLLGIFPAVPSVGKNAQHAPYFLCFPLILIHNPSAQNLLASRQRGSNGLCVQHLDQAPGVKMKVVTGGMKAVGVIVPHGQAVLFL